MNGRHGFALWITGLPASGKSALVSELLPLLQKRDLRPVVLESDVLRKVLAPGSDYTRDARDRFYLQLARLAEMLVRQGMPVIVDATANRSSYREQARSLIPQFVEVFLFCPVEVCRSRDPKGLYAAADRGEITSLPGSQIEYEAPTAAEVVLDCRKEPAANALAVAVYLSEAGLL